MGYMQQVLSRQGFHWQVGFLAFSYPASKVICIDVLPVDGDTVSGKAVADAVIFIPSSNGDIGPTTFHCFK